MELKNHHVVVTGAQRGIGRAFARMCARDGAHLCLVMRKEDALFETELLNLGAMSVSTEVVDLSTMEAVEALAVKLQQRTVDVLFNNAGLLTGGLLEEQPLSDIYKMLQVNVNAVIHLTRALLPQMLERRKGKIIVNSSVSAYMYFPCASTYAASKAAVAAFLECLQVELQGTGVNTLLLITPGIKTDMFDDIAVKYGKNFEVPTGSITSAKYAEIIRDAILNDRRILMPTGATGVGVSIARHFPKIFRWIVGKKFSRKGL